MSAWVSSGSSDASWAAALVQTSQTHTASGSSDVLTMYWIQPELRSSSFRTGQRRRSLPARSMAYFAMGMALHSEGSYEDVLAMISDGLAWAQRDEGSGKLANKAAISHARDRLGPEPMALLFSRVAKPLAAPDTPGCWLAGRRLVAIDGTCLDLPDTSANDAHFGRPGVMKGERSAFPQARVVALAECGTHSCAAASPAR